MNNRCATCRKRKVRCSGEQPCWYPSEETNCLLYRFGLTNGLAEVCSTCLESNYICQGYGETTTPSAPSRPQSAAASRSPAHPSALSNSNNDDSTNQSASAPSSYRSPDSQPPTTAPSSNFDRLPEAMQSQNVQGDHLAMNTGASYGTRNMPFNADKESGQQAAADSPDSSKSKNSLSIRSIRMPIDIS